MGYTDRKSFESGKTGRVLLFMFVVLLAPLTLPFLEYRTDSVVPERFDLFLREEVGGAHFLDETGLSNEMTRADENPHMQHGVVVIGEFHCSQ